MSWPLLFFILKGKGIENGKERWSTWILMQILVLVEHATFLP